MSKKEKWKMIKIIAIFVAFSIIFGKESLAANFIVRNVSNTNQIYFIVNGTTGYVGIGTGNPAYPLYVVGDVYWSGTLQGGIVPWARLQGYNLDVAWSGKLGWGNLTGYNLNVPWTGLLGWRNLTGYDLNVNWIGKLGWGNLTGYPSIIAGAGLTGGGELSTSRSLSIAFGEDFLGWRNLTAYPSPCPAGHAVQAIGDTLTCINLNSTGNVTGVGTTNALTYWTSSNTIGALGFGTAGQFLKSQGSGNLPVWSTIYLGTDTEGNYVAGITAGTGIVVSGTPGEGWSPTVAIDTSIVPRKNVAETITAPWTFAENVWFNKNVFIAGNLSYVNVATLNVNGSLIPIFSGQFDVGNLTYKWRNVTAVNIVGDNVYSGGNPVLTTATSFSNVAASDITVSGTYNSLNLQINAGAVGTNEIADNAVTMSKISRVSCPSGYALVSIGGGSYACIQINATQGVINGSGIVNYIPVFTGVSTIGASPFYLTSNNLNLGRQSLINASWVNASYLNVSAGLVVLPSGNVGVGTTSPVKKLDVVGDINATGAVYSVSGYYVGVNQIITGARVLQNIASISQSLLPTADNTYDLGSSSLRWRNAYFSGTIYGNVQGTITPTGNINMNGYSIYNAYDVNATRIFQGGNRVVDTVIAGNGLIGGGSGPSVTLDVNVNTAKGLQIVSDALETKIGTGLSYDASGNIYVVYGSTAGTAVQGNTQLTINTGTGLTGGTTITLGAGGTVNLGIDNTVVPFKGNNEQISGSWTFLNDLTVMKNLRVAGNITYVNVQTINVNGSLIPPLDNWFDIGNSSNRWRNANFAGSVNTNNLVVSGNVNSNLIPGSDNSYNLGSSSNRWANVYAVNVYASNINGGTPITGSGSTNYLAKFTGSNTIGNSIIYDTGTNVGIGTNNPLTKLDVVGNVNASVYYDRENSARYLDPSGTSVIGAMSMYGGLSMNNNGISGVDTLLINDPGAGEGISWSGTAAGWVIDVSPLDRRNADGNLNIYGTANNIIAWRPTYIYTSTTPQLVINSTGTTAQFILQTSNTVRGNITADGSGNVYITPGNNLVVPSGNVGIGTTVPDAKLTVTPTGGNWNEGISINPSTASGYNAIFFRDTAGSITNTWFVGRQPGNLFSILRQGLTGMTGTSRGDAAFEITPTGVARFGGNVGIGTTNPLNKLEVVGTTNITSAGTMFYVDANGNVWVRL